ncbi:hypothetical protein QUF82_17025 [Thiotrichales bacterium HSG14]|nr:hypothetical protein [Thiotrichales bacterium HSG14]
MIILLFLFSFLSGCGTIIKHLDSSWVDNRTVYEKSQPLPAFEIPSQLSKASQESDRLSKKGIETSPALAQKTPSKDSTKPTYYSGL